MRLRLAFALSALPIAFASYLVACGSEKEPEDLCGWLKDEENCDRQLYADIGATCGTLGVDTAREGFFLSRDKLDVCVLDGAEGGQVLFDPPLDVNQFPVTTASFAFIRGDGTLCGAGAVGADGAMAISVAPATIGMNGIPLPLPDGGFPDGGTACVDNSQPICGGDFSMKSVTERELVDTTCSRPGQRDELHHFNRLQLSKCNGEPDPGVTKEDNVSQLFPRAEFESNAGGVGINGFAKFRVFFPPATGTLDAVAPEVVEYFKCLIPAAATTCANGIQDPGEPAVDCGAICKTGCITGSPCFVSSDCASQLCTPIGGIKECTPDPTCMNGVKDGGETDVDCGGLVCGGGCATGKMCNVDTDCVSGNTCQLVDGGLRICGSPP
jgi:hypothetical protein